MIKVGDLVKGSCSGKTPWTGIVLKIDRAHSVNNLNFPYLVLFNDGDTDWMREGFLEAM
jgi:hypothetical protein